MSDLTETRPSSAAAFHSYLIEQDGYKATDMVELRPLAGASDYIAIRERGDRVDVAAIMDRDNPFRAIPPDTSDDLQGMARSISKRDGIRQVRIAIYEVGRGAIDASAVGRYLGFRRGGPFSLGAVDAWLLDTASGRAWTTRPFASLGARQRIENILRRGIPGSGRNGTDGDKPALMTGLLVLLLFILFGTEIILNRAPAGPKLEVSVGTLSAMGGISRYHVVDLHQWWRIFTAPLLHADILHVGFNCLALVLVGWQLEPLIGRRWFIGIFALSAVGGSLLSIAINPANIVGIGASGGIVGLFAAAVLLAWRHPDPEERAAMLTRAARTLVPAVLPILGGSNVGSGIDYAGHVGGGVAGMAAGLLALALWPKSAANPSRPAIPGTAAVVFFALAALAVVPIVHSYTLFAQAVMPAPVDTSKMSADDIRAIVWRYPHDPQVRLVYAGRLLDQGDFNGAETQLRVGLAESDMLKEVYPPSVEAMLHGLLALVLLDESRIDEAQAYGRTACDIEALPSDFLDALMKNKLCINKK
ncbi:MAG: rhomboid family intramembrane serine protease [Devosia nanyangense]|uniref:Rhomboid family intramembrane serine protease n=1 Tax=Devosia nanyangense TaxID=1228055 RepID=A0A933L611_9HYPH|nr:rhomboid family intramembrane serine protease [Devosia nanyangense]